MNNTSSKNLTLKHIFIYLSGSDSEFKAEHQFLNIACLLGTVFYSAFILINIVFKVDLALTLVKSIGAVFCLVLYFFSRYKHKFKWTSFLFFLILLISYLYIGLKNGGVTGGIAPIYIAVLTFMLFITEGTRRTILFMIWVSSITSLFVLEYLNPDIITPYTNMKQKYIDIYLSYASGIGMITLVVLLVKRLYLKEKLNTEELMKKYRTYNVDIKKKITANKSMLSKREREVCEHILSGKTNQDFSRNSEMSYQQYL
jgi:hypothetical protein